MNFRARSDASLHLREHEDIEFSYEQHYTLPAQETD